jgi:hypothetical protein
MLPLNIKRNSQVCLFALSIFLSSLPVTGFAPRPVATRAPANAQTNETFKFGKTDLDLFMAFGEVVLSKNLRRRRVSLG